MEKFGCLSCLLLVLYTSANKSIAGLARDFVHVEKKMPWFIARDYCLRNAEELYLGFGKNDLMNLSGSASDFSWVGMMSGIVSWKWADETKASYFNWFGECTSMRKNGFWFTLSCDTTVSFVCNKVSGGWILIKQNKTWHDAKLYCETHHAGLAFIGNATDNNNICAVLETDLYYWIGLAVKSAWRWVNNQPLTYSNWYAYLFCAVMDQKGFWHERVCFEKNPFVCFIEINTVRLVNENKTFSEAQSHCKLWGMNLVMVKTQEEITALLKQIQGANSSFVGNPYFWIGLYNDPWLYVKSSPFATWNSMQPDGKDFMNRPIQNTIRSCVAFKEGELYDDACQIPHPFFCSATVRSMILVSEPKSWEEALNHCRDRYVDLVSLGSDAEQQEAVRKVPDVQSYVWTGLRFLQGSWFWVYGDGLQYENWLDGERKLCPVTHRCGALAVSSGKWEPRSCEEKGVSLFPDMTVKKDSETS